MKVWQDPIPLSPNRYERVVVYNVLLTTFLAVLSAVVTVVADGAIQGSLALSNTKAVWLTTLYLLGVNTTVPVAGWFAGRFGYKKMYVLGVFLFTLSSLLVSIATNFFTIALARVTEGIGAGFVFPIGLATMVRTLPPARVSLGLLLYIGASFGAGFALGFPLAGYLSEMASWRAIFGWMVPAGILACSSCILFHKESPKTTSSRFDGWGFGFFATFIASLLIALTYGPLDANAEGWRSPLIISLFAIALLSLLLSLWIEKRHEDPILPLELFKNPLFSLTCVAMFLLGMSIFSSGSTAMRYMIEGLRYERLASGKVGIIYGISIALFSMIGNILLKKIPAPVLTFLGLAILVYSYFLNNELDVHTGAHQMLQILFLRGMGIGLSLGPTTVHAMRTVPEHLSTKGATLLTFFRQVGGTYGGTLLSILIIKRQVFHTARFSETVSPQIPGYQVTYQKILTEFSANTSTGQYQTTLQAKGAIIADIVQQSFVQSINDSLLVLGVVTAFVAMILLVVHGVRFWQKRKSSTI